MPNLQEIFSRVKDVISRELGERKVYDKDIALALGINQITFATMKSRGKIPYEELMDFCARRKISINWLFYNQIVESLIEETEKFARVRFFSDIYASAGGGATNYEEDNEFIEFEREFLQILGISCKAEELQVLNVRGDSMEPNIEDGSLIFLDTTQKEFKRGGIFVLNTPSGTFMKRLQLKTDGTLELISDNALYPPECVEASGVNIIGKVVASIKEV